MPQSRKLSEVLERTIQREIPNIQRTIDENIGKLEKQIEDLGGPTLEVSGARPAGPDLCIMQSGDVTWGASCRVATVQWMRLLHTDSYPVHGM